MRHLLIALVAACGGDPAALDAGPTTDAATVDAPSPDGPPADPISLTLGGAIAPVHDPAIIEVDGIYMLFGTGTGISMRTSVDLMNWSLNGQVFAQKPAWITTTDPARPNDLWAPDVSKFGGTYHLYYSASRFGVNTSCIGHATSANPTTNAWTDHGAIICSADSDTFNAIDPAAFVDANGAPWLAFGSFWTGLKLTPLTAEGARFGTELFALSARQDNEVEAPFIVYRGGYYYLFQSTGLCCRGIESTYEIRVGRAADVRGPYVDAAGVAMLAGGGTLVVTGGSRWKGPGHNAILRRATGDYNVYHSYDANAGGMPTLRISEMTWTADGWPHSAGP